MEFDGINSLLITNFTVEGCDSGGVRSTDTFSVPKQVRYHCITFTDETTGF
jgi:hypothetical protein